MSLEPMHLQKTQTVGQRTIHNPVAQDATKIPVGKPTQIPDTSAPVSESAMIEAKGYGLPGQQSQALGADVARNAQYTKDSTIVNDPLGHIGHSQSEVNAAESHMANVKSVSKTLSRAYDALHGGTGQDTTLVK